MAVRGDRSVLLQAFEQAGVLLLANRDEKDGLIL
jgi:hypothetical protein